MSKNNLVTSEHVIANENLNDRILFQQESLQRKLSELQHTFNEYAASIEFFTNQMNERKEYHANNAEYVAVINTQISWLGLHYINLRFYRSMIKGKTND